LPPSSGTGGVGLRVSFFLPLTACDLRKFAQEVLLLHGYRVLDAENGEDALRVCKKHDGQIDLMIADVVMPKMIGREAAERLQPLYPQMKVIYVSGYTDNTIVHHGVLAPGLNFLEKPWINRHLGHKPAFFSKKKNITFF
jgi:CheY-like chemotaxis protein